MPPASPGTRVLVVLASTDRRGAEIQGTGLAATLADLGADVELVALKPGTRPQPLQVDVVGQRATSPSTLRALRRRARTVDVVIGYGSKTLPAGVLALAGTSTRFIYRSIGDPAEWSRGGLHRVRTGWLFRRVDHVAALWDGAAQSVERLYGVPPDRVTTIPNARRSSDYPEIAAEERVLHRTEFGIEPAQVVIALVGSLTAEKRVGLAIDAASRIEGAVVLIAGDGPLRTAVECAAAAATADVRVLGALGDVRPVLAASDVALSTSSTEGMPGVLIEAALCGIPAVATDVGATALVVGPGGVSVPAGSTPEHIAGAIVDVVARGSVLGAVARHHASTNFTWDAVAPKWVDLIRQVRTYDSSTER